MLSHVKTAFTCTPALIWLRYHAHLANFGYGKDPIVPFCYALKVLQTRLVLHQEPWLDQNRSICRRRVPKSEVRLYRYKYHTNQQTNAESYTAVADIMFFAGWCESVFVNERKVKRHTAAVSLYVAVGL